MTARTIWPILLFFSNANLLFCQNHDHKWVFGYNDDVANPPISSELGRCIIDFSTIPTSVAKSYIRLNFASSASTMCDSSGKLLFYTNGMNYYDRTGKLIPDKLPPSTESDYIAITIAPVPGSNLGFQPELRSAKSHAPACSEHPGRSVMIRPNLRARRASIPRSPP